MWCILDACSIYLYWFVVGVVVEWSMFEHAVCLLWVLVVTRLDGKLREIFGVLE